MSEFNDEILNGILATTEDTTKSESGKNVWAEFPDEKPRKPS